MNQETALHLVSEMTRLLGGGRHFKEGLQPTLQTVMLAFRAEAVQLTFRDELTNFNISRSCGDEALLLDEEHPILHKVHQQVLPMLMNDPDVLPDGTKSIILGRVSGFEESLGVLQIALAEPFVLESADQKLVQMVTDHLGIALSNAEQFWVMQRQSNELDWLNKVGDSLLNLLSTLQIEEVAERIMIAIKEIMSVEETSILLKDIETEDLILWSHTPAERNLSIRLKPGQGIAGWVFQYGKPAIANNVQQDERWAAQFDQNAAFTTRSLIAVPIFLDKETVGVLEAVNKLQGDFTDSDEGLLLTLAKWAAIAIGNANAYEKLKRTTEQLADAKKQAAMAHMVLNLAHKINNSVGAIRVWAMEARDEISQYEGEELAEYKTFVDNIFANTEETLLMVRRIRGATELQTGDIQPINVTETLDAALRFSRVAPSITVHRQYESDVPRIGADPERLVEVFLHLINNASDVLGREGNFTMIARRLPAGLVEIIMQDDGAGIPPHLRGRIFDPFVTSKSDGLGLGLWMVKLYLELIGGSITLLNPSGKGTSFRITLPPWEKSE